MNHDTAASRRNVLTSGLGILVAGTAIAATRAVTAEEKLAQNLVQYQATSKDGHRCDACVHWVAPNGCKIVAGAIAAPGWCAAFAPKQG